MRWAFSIALLLVTSLAPAAQFGTPMLPISTISSDNENPAVAADESGQRLFVVWDGIVENQRRILLREQVAGEWLAEEVIVDAEPVAENQSPAIDVDSSGNYHIAWLARVGGKQRVFYAFRRAGVPVNWGVIDGGEESEQSCKAVTIQLDGLDRPWIVWQSGNGNRVGIRCARPDDNGGFVVDSLVPEADHYNLYPELFFSPDPIVMWYADSGSEVVLKSRVYDSPTNSWRDHPVADFAKIDTDRFPYLLKRSSGLLFALWAGEVDSHDRILLGLQGSEMAGEGTPISFNLDALNDSLSGVSSGNQMLAVWRSWTLEEGAQIFLSHGTSVPFEEEQMVSDGTVNYFSRPRAAALPGGAAIVWQSTLSDGGDGQIYWRQIQF